MLDKVATLATNTNAARLIGFAARHSFPLIAKPRQDFASRGVFLVQNEAQLARDGIPLFRSFEADKHSLQAFIAPDGSLKGLLATRHAMRQGRSERVARNNDPALLQLGQRCAQAFATEGWRGPLNIQCQRTPEGDYAIYEYNGRYTGALRAEARQFPWCRAHSTPPRDPVRQIRLSTSKSPDAPRAAGETLGATSVARGRRSTNGAGHHPPMGNSSRPQEWLPTAP